MKKKEGKKKIKQIIYHFKDSFEFVAYDLDEEGKHLQLKNRAQRKSYKKANKNKAIPSTAQSNIPSTDLNTQTTSFSDKFNLYTSNDLNEFFNFEDEYHTKKYDDQAEQLCYPLITEQDKDFLMYSLSDSENFDFIADGQLILPIEF